MFCPECKTLLVSSKGQLKCRKCGYIRKFKATDQPPDTELYWCFCHRFKCPHRDYSLCPEHCDEPGLTKPCPQGPCQVFEQHPKECERLSIKLQKEAGERPDNIHKPAIHK